MTSRLGKPCTGQSWASRSSARNLAVTFSFRLARPVSCSFSWPKHVKKLKTTGYDGTITLEVFAPQKEYLLLSRDLLRRWWAEA